MAEDFDPYYTWLGIPPDEQPANYYRLLGVRQFEPSLDAISNASDQRMAFLRTLQVGKHGALSQRLLNEIAAAKVCLLDPEQRTVYDQRLQAALRSATAPVSLPVAHTLVRPASPSHAPENAVPQVQITTFAAVDDLPSDVPDRRSHLTIHWLRDAIHRFQNVPLRTVAYGGLVLGAMLLLSTLTWLAVGGNRRPFVEKTLPADTSPSTTADPLLESTEGGPKEDSAKKRPAELLPAYTPPEPVAATRADGDAGGSASKSNSAMSVDYSPLVQVVPGRFRLPYQVSVSHYGDDMVVWRPGEDKLFLFHIGEGKPVELPAPGVSCVAVGRQIVACGTDNSLLIFGISDPRVLWTKDIPGPAREIAVGTYNENVAILCDSDQPLVVVSTQERKLLGPFQRTTGKLTSINVSDKFVVFVSDHKTLCEMDVRTGASTCFLTHPQGREFYGLMISHGLHISAHDDRASFTIRKSDLGVETWTSMRRPAEARIIGHPQGRDLTVVADKGTLTLIRSPMDEVAGSLVWPGENLENAAFSMWGKTMVTGGPDDSLLVWDLSKLEGKPRVMYTSQELAGWKPPQPKKAPPMPVATVPRPEPRPPPSVPAAPVPESGPLEEVEPADALAALRRAGVRNLPNDPASLRTITLQGSQFTNSDAKYIAAFRDLESLFCDDRPIDGKALRYFQGLTELTTLSLGGTAITDEDLAFIGGLKGLRTLRLQGTKITAKGLEHLTGLTSLRDLQLPLEIGREAIPAIANLRELRFLNPFPADMTDQDLANLSQVSLLQSLDLHRARLTPSGYQSLKSFRRVVSLQLHYQAPREVLPYLTEMRLSNFQFPASARDEDVSLFKHMPTLHNVTLNETMTDAALARVAEYPAIHELWLSNNKKISDDGLQHLRAIKGLRDLYLPAGISDVGLKQISGVATLENISLSHDCPVTDDGLAALVVLPKLKNLLVSSHITDRGCESLAKIKSLQFLSFQQSRVGAEGLKRLKSLDQLQQLALFNVPVDQESVKALATLTQLRGLVLQSTGLTPEWEAELRAALPKVQFFISK